MPISLAPFVPSNEAVVTRMLELAKVTSDDVVADLGCGDGRILFSAVQKFGAKSAIGYELRADLYKTVTSKIQKENLDDQIRVFNEDALKADLTDATIITLYLTTSGNSKLKPLLSQMKHGTRIVSHDFRMDGWAYSKRENFQGHTIYLYNIPESLKQQTNTRSHFPFRRRY
jgi:phospholipid N-methyltransferase